MTLDRATVLAALRVEDGAETSPLKRKRWPKCLDRIEPTGGYDPGNVVPACTRCNHARGAFITFEEFTLIMRMRRERMGPSADLWGEHPPRGLMIAVRRSR